MDASRVISQNLQIVGKHIYGVSDFAEYLGPKGGESRVANCANPNPCGAILEGACLQGGGSQ